jgi:hypothetical protein
MSVRKNKLLLKGSNVPGKVPSDGDLELKELALNFADVILYASGTTANSIIPIGWDRVARTGDIMTGTLYVPSISATTISATTFYGDGQYLTGINDYYVTGGTFSGTTLTLNRQDGSILVTGFTSTSVDTYTTGFTYSNNNLTILQNNNQSPLNVNISLMTGLTVNGNSNFNVVTATSVSNLNYIIFNTGTTSGTTLPGTVYFDNTEKALSYNTSINQGVTVNLGQQNYIRVFNNSGVDIQRGKALEILSAYNGLPSVILAINKHEGFSIIGMSAEIIPNNTEGIVITSGIISNIELTGMTVGSLMYASDSIPGNIDEASKYFTFPLTARTNSVGYVIQTGSTTGKLFVNIENENPILSFTDLERNVLEGNVISTGVFEFKGISISTGNTFNVGSVEAYIVDNTSNPLKPNALYVPFIGQSGLTTPYLTTDTETYILLTSGGTISLQPTFPTPQQRRLSIYLGKLGHGNKTSLINAFNEPDLDISPLSQLRDVFSPIKLINDGVVSSPNGVNLNFNTSAGYIWGLGINFVNDVLNPSRFTVPSNSPTTFQYRTRTGGTASNTTLVIPGSYDLNGVITPVGTPAKQATNQRIFLLQNGQIRLQYGQQKYIDLPTAIAATQNENFTTFANFRDNAILIGVLSLRSDATNLSSTSQALFHIVSKFGELGGGTAGISTTTLQQAYNNSSNPEIITNPTQNSVQFRGGTGNDTDKTITLENNIGTPTAWILGDGGATFSSVSATTYYNLPTTVDTYTTGFTYSNNNLTISQNQGQSPLTVNISSITNSATNLFNYYNFI